jgi:hypothetical protein
MKFSSFLTEQKNAHMEHLEDMIFNDGVDGARLAITSLQSLRDMLAGRAKKKVNMTVKWDGAPAIFAGVDPSDGKFFVAKKGVFNANPQLFKSEKDIDGSLSGDLANKFKIALREFSKLGIRKGMYQGDLMFTKSDLKVSNISGEKYITFQPNTIMYAVPVNSELARIIQKSQIGVVWHTTYTGSSLQRMKGSFGKGIASKMKQSRTVWMDDATYRDLSGNATFTEEETNEITKMLSDAGKLFRKIPSTTLSAIKDDEELKQKIKTYNNTFVRAQEPFPEPRAHVKGLYQYITDWYQKEIDTKKQEKTKQAWTAKRDIVLKKVFQNTEDLVIIFKLMNLLVQAKQMVINKLNRTSSIDTFLRTKKGIRATNQEGFVAIDRLTGGAVKLVDRMEFSYSNFSPEVLKGWDK